MGQIWAKPDRLPQHEAPVPGQRMCDSYTFVQLSKERDRMLARRWASWATCASVHATTNVLK
jgi:hypothetical protein